MARLGRRRSFPPIIGRRIAFSPPVAPVAKQLIVSQAVTEASRRFHRVHVPMIKRFAGAPPPIGQAVILSLQSRIEANRRARRIHIPFIRTAIQFAVRVPPVGKLTLLTKAAIAEAVRRCHRVHVPFKKTKIRGSGSWKCIKYTKADGQVLTKVTIPLGGTNAITAVAANDNLHPASTNIAAATTTNLDSATGGKVTITGSTTITAFTLATAGTVRRLTFQDAPKLTYNATSLKLPGAADIQAAAGDTCEVVSLGSSNVEVRNYVRAAVAPYTTPDQLDANVRLTLTSSTPITTTDVTSANLLYATPHRGNALPFYNGVEWLSVGFSEMSIKSVDVAQTGTTTSGLKTITGLTDTSKLARGMTIGNANIGGKIASIDSATQVTGDTNATGTGSAIVSFSVGGTGANQVADVFAVLVSGVPALRFSLWTSATARANAISRVKTVYVNTSVIASGDSNSIPANQGTYLGTINAFDVGKLFDSLRFRWVWNNYNRVARKFYSVDTTNSWNYTTATFQQANASNTNQVELVIGLSEDLVEMNIQGFFGNASSVNAAVGVGVDSTTVNSADIFGGFNNAGTSRNTHCVYRGYPGIGYHYLAWLEISDAAGTTTWYGDNGKTYFQSGMSGWILG